MVSDGSEGGLPKGTRSLSLFLVNRRDPAPDEKRDEAFAFQAELEVECDAGFVPRPNLRSLESDEWDERLADLQYRDACEFAVGHSVATEVAQSEGRCRRVRTCWRAMSAMASFTRILSPGLPPQSSQPTAASLNSSRVSS